VNPKLKVTDDDEDVLEIHYTEDGLSYTSDDLVRRLRPTLYRR
jgi:hypothetical protein